MATITLDAKLMKDVKSTHNYLKEKFNFPYYYGENLDALYDCLGDIMEETVIELENSQSLKDNLGDYAEKILSIFRNLEEDYMNFKFEIIS